MHHLVVAFFATSDAKFSGILDPYVAGANGMLAPYEMAIETFPTNGSAGGPRILGYTGVVLDGPGDPGTVRAQAHNAVPQGRGIPVIFCKRQTDDSRGTGFDFGATIQTNSPVNNGIQWLPYILINTQVKSASNEVLLHELIHAAYGSNQPGHDASNTSVFFPYSSESNGTQRTLSAPHASALRRAYFSVVVS
ncbi:MAG TPA: hypothetical protein VK437_04405 [Steroidobacteraceae bacterium]|nr:hypothetical protein [Steroidobacteraceae bacterium]